MQLEIILTILYTKEDVFVHFPTGGGKSLLYQLAAVLRPGITVVILPLRALVEDQFRRAQAYGIASFKLLGQSRGVEAGMSADLDAVGVVVAHG